LLLENVKSVLGGTVVPDELVVVDDSDVRNDELANLTTERKCDIRYLWTRRQGLSRATNDGIAEAKHDLLVFSQDDVRVAESWFTTIVGAAMTAEPRSVVTGRVLPTSAEAPRAFAVSNMVRESPAIYRGRLGSDVLLMQNMAMYRSAYEEAGSFDERLGPGTRFPASEDSDFAYRLLEKGYSIVYVPDAVAFHRAWRDEATYIPLRWQYGFARGGFYAKYVSRRDSHMFRRMISDVLIHLRFAPSRARNENLKILGDVALAAGIVTGSLSWTLRYTVFDR
jgi:GT2 family glycosyltransferase